MATIKKTFHFISLKKKINFFLISYVEEYPFWLTWIGNRSVANCVEHNPQRKLFSSGHCKVGGIMSTKKQMITWTNSLDGGRNKQVGQKAEFVWLSRRCMQAIPLFLPHYASQLTRLARPNWGLLVVFHVLTLSFNFCPVLTCLSANPVSINLLC